MKCLPKAKEQLGMKRGGGNTRQAEAAKLITINQPAKGKDATQSRVMRPHQVNSN